MAHIRDISDIDDGGLRFTEGKYHTPGDDAFQDFANLNVVEDAPCAGQELSNGRARSDCDTQDDASQCGDPEGGGGSTDGTGTVGDLSTEGTGTVGDLCPISADRQWVSSFRKKDLKKLTLHDFDDVFFETYDDAVYFYSCYAYCMGFCWKLSRVEKKEVDGVNVVMRREFRCSKHSTYRGTNPVPEEFLYEEPSMQVFGKKNVRRGVKFTGTGCRARFNVKYDEKARRYVVRVFEPEHNHTLADFFERHFLRCNRHVTLEDALEVLALQSANVGVSAAFDHLVRQAGGAAFVGFTQKDLYNKLDRLKNLSSETGDCEAAMKWLESKGGEEGGFFARFCKDHEGRLAHLFWRDSVSFDDYQTFGDILIMDCTYRTNVYDMPLLLFVGLNNHRASVVFGCALLCNEREKTFNWAITKFLESMKGEDGTVKMPKSVVTDGAESLIKALATHMPESRHRLCSWHVGRNVTNNLSNKTVENLVNKMIYASHTVQEWEAAWATMLREHNMGDNEWLRSLYNKRSKWAEAFLRGHFYGGVCSTQRCEGMNRAVKVRVGRYTTLTAFLPRLHQGLGRLRDRVLMDNFKSRDHARNWRTLFRTMEEEVFQKFTDDIYVVITGQMNFESHFFVSNTVSWNDGHNVFYIKQYAKPERLWIVNHSSGNTDSEAEVYECSCLLFESDGIPCCHIFCVLKRQGVTSYPKSLICQRWTKSAGKKTVLHQHCSDDANSPQPSRYLSLITMAKRVCAYFAQSAEGYSKGMSELSSLIEKSIQFRVSKKPRLIVGDSANVCLDPVKARTKAVSAPRTPNRAEPDPWEGKRKCSFCKETGHNSRTCERRKQAELTASGRGRPSTSSSARQC